MPPHAAATDIPLPATAFKASDHANDGKTHILIAATGSVATIKIPLILAALSKYSNLSIRLVPTSASLLFLPPLTELQAIPSVDGIHLDHHEWPVALSSSSPSADLAEQPGGASPQESSIWARVGDPILHIELRRWADILLIAPLSANTLAKIVNGLTDNLLLSVIRAWDTAASKVIAVAPAMNTKFWDHPITAKQIAVLEEEWTWFRVLYPMKKLLACGDNGNGAMKEWSEIVTWLVDEMKLEKEDGSQ